MSIYRFPAMKPEALGDPQAQLGKIEDEAIEAIQACGNAGLMALEHGYASEEFEDAMTNYGMELLDIIHATETALRMEFTDEEVEELRARVIEKNARRSYYRGDHDEIRR